MSERGVGSRGAGSTGRAASWTVTRALPNGVVEAHGARRGVDAEQPDEPGGRPRDPRACSPRNHRYERGHVRQRDRARLLSERARMRFAPAARRGRDARRAGSSSGRRSRSGPTRRSCVGRLARAVGAGAGARAHVPRGARGRSGAQERVATSHVRARLMTRRRPLDQRRGCSTSGAAPDRPVLLLSDNGVDHALVQLAAMHAAVPAAPVSPAYSLASRDFGKLREIVADDRPGRRLRRRPRRSMRARSRRRAGGAASSASRERGGPDDPAPSSGARRAHRASAIARANAPRSGPTRSPRSSSPPARRGARRGS